MKTLEGLRKQKLLSRMELAKEIGVSEQSIFKWEKGQVSPSLKNVRKLSQFFDVNPNIFLS